MGDETARNRHVLVAAGDSAVRAAVTDVICELSMMSCVDVATLDAARAAMKNARPAALVMDADLAGPELVSFLDELVAVHGPPVVLVSTRAAIAHVAARYGVPFVRAPFEVDALVDALDDARSQPQMPSAPPGG